MSRTVRVAASAAALWLAVFVVVPVVVLLAGSLKANDFSRVLTNDVTWKVVWFSTWQSILSTGATFVLAMPVTWLIGRYHFLGRRALRAVTTIGFLLPSVVVAAAFLAVLPRSLHYSVFAVVLAHAYFNLAVIVRVAASAAAMWLAVFVVVPVVVLLAGSLKANDFSRVLTNDVTWKVVWFSTWQSILST
ncbi:MAG: hypothetical protein ACKOI3_00285, partial [Actinomycetota bacterium]